METFSNIQIDFNAFDQFWFNGNAAAGLNQRNKVLLFSHFCFPSECLADFSASWWWK